MIKLIVAFVIAQAADLGTTVVNLSHGCTEFNPIYQGTTAHLVSMKLFVTVGTWGVVWGLNKHGSKMAGRYAKVIIWSSLIAAGSAAMWNLWIAQYCGK